LTKNDENKRLKLVLIGSCRGNDDWNRVKELQTYAEEELDLKPGKDFEFRIDAPKDEVDSLLSKALIGIHTMWNEHFGIGIVEMMSAGVIVLAHDSGGPKFDIVKSSSSAFAPDDGTRAGYLASDEDSYAEAMRTIKSSTKKELGQIRTQARQNIQKFTEEEFAKQFCSYVEEKLLTQ